jgi:hypothetical protein
MDGFSSLRRANARFASGISAFETAQARIQSLLQTRAFIMPLLVGMGSVGVLAGYARVVDIHRLHYFGGLIDQVWHITAARQLADTGTLESNVIFPSVIQQPYTRNLFYMPGYYFILAAIYKLLGYGVFQSLLPSLLSFVVAAVCTFLIAKKCFNQKVGMIAVWLFLFFPAIAFYALTAMIDMTVLATSAVSVCAFMYLPRSARPWAGPLCVGLPFLFRETTALLIVPLAILILLEHGQLRARVARALGFGLVTLLCLNLLYGADFSAGRPSLIQRYWEGNGFDDYFDGASSRAFNYDPIGSGARVIRERITTNVAWLLFDPNKSPGELPLLFIIWGSTAVALLYGIMRRDAFAIAFGLLALGIIIFDLFTYRLSGYIGLRIFLFTTPFLAIIIGRIIEVLLLARVGPRWQRLALGVQLALALVLALAGVWTVRAMFKTDAGFDLFVDGFTRFVEQIHPDERYVVVSAFPYSGEYTLEHYPVRWSLIPANRATLRMLAARYQIGTLVLPLANRIDAFPLTAEDMASTGLVFDEKATFSGFEFAIYRRGAK